MIKEIKTVNGFLYLLYQTDVWKTKSSGVCFGVFDSYEHAYEAAQKNGLCTPESSVGIKQVKINEFAEVL